MKLSDLVIRLAYQMEESEGYKRAKQAVYDLLENPHSRARPYFDSLMMALVLSSVFLLLYSVKHHLGAWAGWFEAMAVSFFILEYLGRMWVYSSVHRIVLDEYEKSELINEPFRLSRAVWNILRSKWSYMSSPMAIIDLLAILPSYRSLRILRLFLLFRLFKMFRYAHSIQQFGSVLREKRIELFSLFAFLTFVLLVGSSVIYLFESRETGGQIEGFFEGIYWSLVTLSTVGYGDITPQSFEGRLVTMVLIISGLGVLSFFTSIIVSAFQEKMGEVRDRRVAMLLEKKKGYTVICGFGRVGQVVAEYLAKDKLPFVIIDSNAEAVELARRLGYLVVEGKSERIGLLQMLGVGRSAGKILCLTGDDVVNVYVTLSARQLDENITIISRANQRQSVDKLLHAGADHAIEPFKIVGLIAGEYVGQPVAFEAIHGIVMGEKDITLETIRVPPDSWLDGKTIGEVPLEDMRLILFGVSTPMDRSSDHVRSHFDLESRRFHFNPGADFVLQADDMLLVFGHKYSVLHMRQQLKSGRKRG
ncbi:ion transporter [Thiolapillus sp.]